MRTVYSSMAGSELVFAAQESVSPADFAAWTGALTFVTAKTPSAGGYTRMDPEKYKIDNIAKTVTFDGGVFSETGSYSFIFHASGYADRSVSLTVKKPSPPITGPASPAVGGNLAFTFPDAEYQNGLTLYVTPEGGEPVMISTSYLDRSAPGRLTLRAAWFALPHCPVTEAGIYGFSFVNSRYEPGTVELSQTLAAGAPLSFDDAGAADASKWYYDAVAYVTAYGLFDATGGNSFGVADPMTRAMFATAMYRLEGKPGSAGSFSGASSGFSDVPDGAELAAAVSWANGADVVEGVGGGLFAPDANITREQIAAMLFRYAAYKADDTARRGDVSAFSDAEQISPWAAEAFSWAAGMKIIHGMGDGAAAPQGISTRAQVAQMLLNYSTR